METNTKPRFVGSLAASRELGYIEDSGMVRRLCREGRIEGAFQLGRDWIIPTPVVLRRGPARGRPKIALDKASPVR